MRNVTVRRSLNAIADDIVSALEPLKHDFDKTRSEILGVLSNYQKCGLSPKIGAVSVIRRGQSARWTPWPLSRKVYPPIHRNGSDPTMGVWNMVDVLVGIERTSRADISHEAYAYLAGTLVKKYSDKEPVMSEAKHGGNVHLIAQWLFEAITGKQTTRPTALLKVVRKVHGRRWPVNSTASK